MFVCLWAPVSTFLCCAAASRLFAGPVDPSDTGLILDWQRYFRCGEHYYNERQLTIAENCFASALVIAERLTAGDFRRGTTLSSLGIVLLEQGRIPEAERAVVRGVALLRKCGGDNCEIGLGSGLHNLAIIYRQQNRLFEAERLLGEAIGAFTRARAGKLSVARVLSTLGLLEFDRNRPRAAESHFRRALLLIQDMEDAHHIRAELYASLSSVLLEMKRNREGAEAAQQALAAASSGPGVRPLEIVRYSCSLAMASSAMRDYALAESTLIRAQETLSNVPGVESAEFGTLLSAFGDLRFGQKRFAEAAQFQSRAIDVLGNHVSAGHRQMLGLKAYYAVTLRRLKRKQEAKLVERELRQLAGATAVDPGSSHRIGVSDLQRENGDIRDRTN